MHDLISRQAAIDAADRADYTGLAVEDVKKVTDEVAKEIKKLPSAQPEEASMILGASKDGVRLWYKCSVCGEPANADDNYCCNCGRKFING